MGSKSKIVFSLFVILVLATLFFSSYSNFHEVTPGVLYRSRQLSGSQLDHFIKKYKIKTVINLRGASPEAKWYLEEMKVVQKDTVSHLDIRLSALRYVPPQKVDSIMVVAASAARPILVHCQGGADRSGLFCAAWKLRYERASVERASHQLSFIYGHIPFFRNRTEVMDSSFYTYAGFLESE